MNLAVGQTQGMLLAAFIAALLVLIGGASAARAADGDILFKQCVSDSGSSGACTDGQNLLEGLVWDVAVSPDGRHAYVIAIAFGNTGALHVFDRDPRNGAHHRQRSGAANCYKQTPSAGDCTQVRAMADPVLTR